MLKFTNYMVTFREVPDEISLCINISNCPNRCPGCHSKELWEDIGEELTNEKLCSLIEKNKGITCVCFMGGDSDPKRVEELCKLVKTNFPALLTCWYSGKRECSIDLSYLNYLKLGPYIEQLGGLDHPTTNQRFYEVELSRSTDDNYNPEYGLFDITDKFWK